MNELDAVLRAHARSYPLMEPQDAVKLVYQNEFGCGHLIQDTGESLALLEKEYALAGGDAGMLLLESIGNGMARLHLASAKAQGIQAAAIHELFAKSVSRTQGSQASFEEKLMLLQRTAGESIFAFSREELMRYLNEYARAGYPAVSHSEPYRAAYRPAYRVVATQYCRF